MRPFVVRQVESLAAAFYSVRVGQRPVGVKSTKQWVRVSRSSKLFKDASFFFPGDYEKPTKNNYWQLLNRVHQDIEKAEGSGK